MKNNLIQAITFSVFSIPLLLVGCGGGGADVNSGYVPPVTTTAVATTTTTTILAAKPQTAVAPTYAVGSNELAAFNALNAFRAAVGLGPVNQNSNLDMAAKNHGAYLVASFQTGDDFHTEIAGRAGFTGVTFFDREVAAGYAAVGGTETGAPETGSMSITGLADTVYHRQGMMIEGLTDAGMISTTMNGTITDYGFITPQNNAGDFVGVYPSKEQTGVSLIHALETPNPFPDMEMTVANMCTKTSYPISLQTQANTVLAVTTFTVTEDGQTATLPVRLLTSSNDARIMSNVAFIVGTAPFKTNTKYNVSFTGTAIGAATGGTVQVSKNWSFTTGVNYLTCPE